MKLPRSIFVVAALALVFWASWLYTATVCWRHGGTVLKNAFDWPTCVEVRQR